MLSVVQGSLRPQRPRRVGRRIGPEEAGMADLIIIGCPDETTSPMIMKTVGDRR
jgi:hypothetical protein